jgi:D-amino-acid dehydrogenase
LPADRHVVIVGGGVIGVCVAHFLAKRGAAVTLMERDEIGAGASAGNAGCIAPGHGPINKPGRVRQALESMFDELSPLYVAPRLDPSLARWLWMFARHCSELHLRHAMRALGPLGHASSALFDQLVHEEALECAYRHDGYYEVFLTRAKLDAAQRETALMRHEGYRPEALPGGAMREREPALNERVIGGVFYPEAASVDPHRFVTALAERARGFGVVVRTKTEVVGVETTGGMVRGVRTRDGETVEADAVVLATGAYSLDLARRLGLALPLQPAKGYHRDREPRAGETPALRTTCMLGERSVFLTPMDGFLRFAGTLEFSGENHEIRRPRLEQLTKAAALYFDGVAVAESRSEWCGLRPCVADGLPVAGPVPGVGGAFVATGHAMLGLTLGPVTGKLMAEYVLDGRPSLDISALRADRF